MVDEFQDTNRLQLDCWRCSNADNLFAVGDEFQSIYGFRHADVTIFRERRAALGEGGVRPLTANFRSPRGAARRAQRRVRAQWASGFAPLLAGDGATGAASCACSTRASRATPSRASSCCVTDARGWEDDDRLGLAGVEAKPRRRAEARVIAHRLRASSTAGARGPRHRRARPRDGVAAAVRGGARGAGVPTYVVGGRGYWSQQQVRDGLAYLSALANPLDEEALLGVLASPFCGRRRPTRWSCSRPAGERRVVGRRCGRRGAAARRGSGGRARAARATSRRSSPPSASAPSGSPSRCCSSERSTATGYDLAVLARAGGERRLANLRKLMRLAREYERAEGRDLRGFLDLRRDARARAAAREGEAPLESEGLDAVRLMTIHRAKGLEFPVVCVADLGRQGGGRTERLLLGADGAVGLRLSTPGGGATVPALAYERLAAEAAAEEDAEERRLFYVAMTRACDRLILSGAADPEKRPAPRPGGPPLDWIGPALLGGPLARRPAAARPVAPRRAGGRRRRAVVPPFDGGRRLARRAARRRPSRPRRSSPAPARARPAPRCPASRRSCRRRPPAAPRRSA